MNNYHTHTSLCHHAEGKVLDYTREAQLQGIHILGMSDHAPLPDSKWPGVRMTLAELDIYEGQIQEARREVKDITILKGLECEWDPSYRNFYTEELLEARNFDYLIGAEHWFPFHGEWNELSDIRTASHLKAYSDLLIQTMESGVFDFIAHPDAFGSGYDKWDRNTHFCSLDILTAAAELQIPLEINGFGFRKQDKLTSIGPRNKYPLPEFWELAAEFPIKAICNSDAHRPQDVGASIKQGRQLAARFGIEVLEKLPLKCPAESGRTGAPSF